MRSTFTNRLGRRGRIAACCAASLLLLGGWSAHRVARGEEAAAAPAEAAAPASLPVAAEKAGPAVAKPADAGSEALEWTRDLAAGYRAAQAAQRPVLILVTSRVYPDCREMDKTLADPALRKALAGWELVEIDADRSPADVVRLEVRTLPSLVLQAPDGRGVAVHTGTLSVTELADWCQEHYAAARIGPHPALIAAGPPKEEELVQLVAYLGDRNALLREAAIQRMSAHPVVCAVAVAQAAAEGTLAQKLSALEILDAWQAPIAGLDPWRPETMSAERLAALAAWAEERSRADAAASTEVGEAAAPLAGPHLAAAEREIAALLKASELDVPPIQERLARLGPALLPVLQARLAEPLSDAERQRLAALRYRLAATSELVLQWPGGLTRLSAADAPTRQAAARELADRAVAADQPLLIELFSDSDPLVRELSLHGLRRIGNQEATSALVGLLHDPSANVRAAVLGTLAEQPPDGVVGPVAEYAKTEIDTDLVVHAVRVLRAASASAEAQKALFALASNPAWQVRAEAIDALGELKSGQGWAYSNDSSSQGARASEVLIKALDDDDPFVVGRAAAALEGWDLPAAVDPLLKALERHPQLTEKIIATFGKNARMRKAASATLRKYLKDPQPALRAASVAALTADGPEDFTDLVLAALADAERPVRIAGAKALWQDQWSRVEKLVSVDAATLPSVQSVSPLTPVESVLKFFGFGKQSSDVTIAPAPMPATTEEETAPEAPRGEAVGPAPDETPIVAATEVETTEIAPTSAVAGPSETAPAYSPTPMVEGPAAMAAPLGATAGYATPAHPVLAAVRPVLSTDSSTAPVYGMPPLTPPMQEFAEKATPLLRSMMASDDLEERSLAAMDLALLGHADEAAPVLLADLRKGHAESASAGAILPAFDWETRQALFAEILPQSGYAGYDMVAKLGPRDDPRVPALVWKTLENRDLPAATVAALTGGLDRWLTGSSYPDDDARSPSVRKETVAMAEPYARQGSPGQRVAGLTLLALSKSDVADEIAEQVLADPQSPPELRTTALRARFFALDTKRANQFAAEMLASDDRKEQEMAIAFVVEGTSSLSNVYGDYYFPITTITYGSGDFSFQPPAGLKVEHLQPLLASQSPDVAAAAGYLLALMGDDSGLEKLLAHGADDRWRNIQARAIAALDAEDRMPLLESMYANLKKSDSTYEIREFYWTIRPMTGPAALKLRKRIRDEVGMEQLR